MNTKGSGTIEQATTELVSQLRATLGKMETALGAIPDAIVWTGEKGRIQWCNAPFDRLVGKRHLEVLGRRLIDLLPLEQQGRPLSLEAHPTNLALKSRESAAGGYEFRQGDRKLSLEVSWAYIQLGEHETSGVLVIWDITERKRVEEELRRAQEELNVAQRRLIEVAKLETVSQLSAGAAHAIKNPLAILRQGIDYLSKKVPAGDPKTYSALEQMVRAIDTADIVIRQILDFGKLSGLRFAAENLLPRIEQALLLVESECDHSHIKVVKEFQPNLPPVKLDKDRIEQVFVNLFLNAAQAMPQGGTLWVKAYTKKFTEVGHHVGRRKEDQFKLGETALIVDIEDSGSGIPEEHLTQVFAPFFTTRRGQGGTGLGLAVARSILEMHQGTIEVANRPEGGVRARVMLKAG